MGGVGAERHRPRRACRATRARISGARRCFALRASAAARAARRPRRELPACRRDSRHARRGARPRAASRVRPFTGSSTIPRIWPARSSSSPFDEAAVCAIDGFGDFVSTSWARRPRTRRWTSIQRTFFPHSLGLLYLAITQYLGFPKYGDEFKVMGLAPYGEPRLRRARSSRWSASSRTAGSSSTCRTSGTGPDGVDDDVGRRRADDRAGVHAEARAAARAGAPARRAGRRRGTRRIAASLQAVFEEAAFHVLNGTARARRGSRGCAWPAAAR